MYPFIVDVNFTVDDDLHSEVQYIARNMPMDTNSRAHKINTAAKK